MFYASKNLIISKCIWISPNTSLVWFHLDPLVRALQTNYAFDFLLMFDWQQLCVFAQCNHEGVLTFSTAIFRCPPSLRRDQRVPWSVCTLGTRRRSSTGGRWALTSSWRGWSGTRRPSSASANAPWATATARPPRRRGRFQQTWDQYVTRAVTRHILSMMTAKQRAAIHDSDTFPRLVGLVTSQS